MSNNFLTVATFSKTLVTSNQGNSNQLTEIIIKISSLKSIPLRKSGIYDRNSWAGHLEPEEK